MGGGTARLPVPSCYVLCRPRPTVAIKGTGSVLDPERRDGSGPGRSLQVGIRAQVRRAPATTLPP